MTRLGPARYTILLGNGDGTFQAEATSEIGTGRLYIADFNLDGRSDLSLLHFDYCERFCYYFTRISVFLGKNDGTFQAPVQISEVAAEYLLIADLNHDQRPDIVTSHAVLLGNGDGSFQSLTRFTQVYSSPSLAADLDGDTHPDLVMTNGSEAEVTTCWIWRGTGDGTISSEEITSFNEQRSFGADALLARTAADLDDDGRFDLVLITPRLVTILLNKTEVAPR